MSIHINYNDWNSAEECLEWLFKNHSDMKNYGCLRVWQESFATLNSKTRAGSYQPLYPRLLENRVYSVRFSENSVAVCYHDEVFIAEISNRRYPEQVCCVKAPLPFI